MRRLRISITVLLAAVGPASAPTAQAQGPRSLNDLLATLRQQHGVPALAGAIVERGRVTALGASGVRRIGSAVAVTTGDRWYLGSCTKAMTATVLARLVVRGVVRWDTTMGEIFPDLRGAMHADHRGVTVRQLVDHRAGLPVDRSGGGIVGALWSARGSVRARRLQVVERALAAAPAGPAGEYRYSNTGFIIAGAVVERLTDDSWEDAMRTELFVPLGMTTAGFGAPGRPGDPDRPAEPWGHLRVGKQARPCPPDARLASSPGYLGPSGNVHASLPDWARFLALHVRGARGGFELLPASVLAVMHAPADGAEYACGFAVARRSWASGPALGHHGSNALWHATVWASPADDFAVLAACNEGGENAARACDAVVAALLARRTVGHR